jgi:hypothetical protein
MNRRSMMFTCTAGVSTAFSRLEGETNAWRIWNSLVDYLSWIAYWDGLPSLQFSLKPMKNEPIYLFWRQYGLRSTRVGSVGMCSAVLGHCIYWPSLGPNYEPQVEAFPSAGVLSTVGARFRARTDIDESDIPYAGAPQIATLTVTLDSLRLPKALRERKQASEREIKAITQTVRCPGAGQQRCRPRISIPYFADEDSVLYVYRECPGPCRYPPTVLVLIRLDSANWFLSVTGAITDPSSVQKMKLRIRNALMREIIR